MGNTPRALAAAGALLIAVGAAGCAQAAQAWQSINQRQANLDARIDAGVADGSLSRAEAAKLRSEFGYLARLERWYRTGGLNTRERADLDRRFDALSLRIRNNRHDDQTAGDWRSINQRQANLESRIQAGVRDGTLTRAEAVRLRGEFRRLARLEARYRRGGLTRFERADLDRRFDTLSNGIRYQRADNQRRW